VRWLNLQLTSTCIKESKNFLVYEIITWVDDFGQKEGTWSLIYYFASLN
jgi:hypothetical protein